MQSGAGLPAATGSKGPVPFPSSDGVKRQPQKSQTVSPTVALSLCLERILHNPLAFNLILRPLHEHDPWLLWPGTLERSALLESIKSEDRPEWRS